MGVGWLGLPLGKHLAGLGFQVKGSTTRLERAMDIRAAGIQPFLIQANPEIIGDDAEVARFFRSDLLILNIPPGRKKENVIAWHLAQIHSVIDQITKFGIKKIIFVSSTSVYSGNEGLITEEMPPIASKESGEALLEAEHRLQTHPDFDTTIVRFGGLYSEDRHPGRFLAGRKGLTDPHLPVNLIHREDCIGVITTIIQKNVWGEAFNAASDEHPPRGAYYTKVAQILDLEPPEFEDRKTQASRIISNEAIKSRLGYAFKFPDPSILK